MRGPHLLSGSVLCLSLLACSSAERKPLPGQGPGTPGDGTPNGGIIEGSAPAGTNAQACPQNVDIVFVMDVSTSMGAFLSKLSQEIDTVDKSVNALSNSAIPHYGLAVFVDDAKLLNNGAPFQNVAVLRKEFDSWASFTSTNQELGGGETNSTWPENSIDALYSAAKSYAWRPGSLRIIIHTTDDTFWNGPVNENDVLIQHGYQETLQTLLDQEIRVFSFAAKHGGPDETDDVSQGWFKPYGNQAPIPTATGGFAYELEGVVSGQTSLSASIEKIVADTLCQPYPHVR